MVEKNEIPLNHRKFAISVEDNHSCNPQFGTFLYPVTKQLL